MKRDTQTKINNLSDQLRSLNVYLHGDHCKAWIRADLRQRLIGRVANLQTARDELVKTLEEPDASSTP